MALVLAMLSAAAMQSAPTTLVQPVDPAGASRILPLPEATEGSKLLALAQSWVDTWNHRDLDRMQQLHDGDFTYNIFGSIMNGRELLAEMRRENFWSTSWSLKMEDPQVQLLDVDTALVLFRLVGTSRSAKGTRPYRSLFTLVFQKRGGAWKIVHVHDSEFPEASS